jgi:hypothetical protein
MSTKILLKNVMVRDYLEDVGVGGSIILKWILGKYDWMVWTG